MSKDDKEIITLLYNRYTSYHDQKENITYIGLGLEITLLTVILSLQIWPPKELIDILNNNDILKLIYPFLLGIGLSFFHIFIRIQLRLKRWAAIKTKILHKALIEDNSENKTEKKGNNSKKNQIILFCKKLGKVVLSLLDHLIPISGAKIGVDVNDDYFPEIIKNYFKLKENNKTKSIRQEWVITIISFLIVFTIFIVSSV